MVAAIGHTGESSNAGHYKCFARTERIHGMPACFELNDSHVAPARRSFVLVRSCFIDSETRPTNLKGTRHSTNPPAGQTAADPSTSPGAGQGPVSPCGVGPPAAPAAQRAPKKNSGRRQVPNREVKPKPEAPRPRDEYKKTSPRVPLKRNLKGRRRARRIGPPGISARNSSNYFSPEISQAR